ncbi:MAG: DUF5320 family protein [Candidatus Moranbacteria bacterium]|nr:DUF5320 family protein [Candidatus Moranbacteria bacterium]MDD5652359.1 DUF5320 family protein [Candidatus Moranbacteria bacterium]MDX9855710.1 DUF5320 family protein [Candidatus Moranbacteria bacterium]
MPRQDKTGPAGMGPMSGGGMGPCNPGYGSGLGLGRGYGRVMCGWFWRKYQDMPKEERKDLLKSEIEDLKQELEMVEGELKELEK